MKNLSASWKRGFAIAKVAKEYSNGDRPGEKMGAALFSGSILVAVGYNTYEKTHPNATNAKEKKYLLSIHAEHQALLKRRYIDDSNLIMYVYREISDNKGFLTQAISKPCLNCQIIMRLAGVKRVRYYSEKGIEEMKL
jgi:deoxycytidylate deaminase